MFGAVCSGQCSGRLSVCLHPQQRVLPFGIAVVQQLLVIVFSFFWLLSWLLKNLGKPSMQWLAAGLVTALHLLAYPALIWFISGVFNGHTFPFCQTFSYGLSAYCLQTVIMYVAAVVVFRIFFSHTIDGRPTNLAPAETQQDLIAETTLRDVLQSILVTNPTNQKEVLQVTDILYFTAQSPYIHIHHRAKTYLHSGTLKLLETQLDGENFVRIHKSCIVNLHFVSFIRSRNNGDYDITLTNERCLRVSRSYAKGFKSKWTLYHQLSR
jgi:two-component system, LytTR family, response regulator LytT